MADRFDLDAIEADDALLDLLAAGGESAWEAGEHDPALKLLAGLRLAVEVEDELPVETIDDPESFLARCAAMTPVMDPFARKMAARSLALGVAAVAALSVSGVAAAVTGDPLSPYEKVIEKVVDGLRAETSFPKEQLDGMPVVDKTKIVKVAKDFEQKAKDKEKAQYEEQGLAEVPAQAVVAPKPPLARPIPQTEQQLLIEKPISTLPAVEQPTEPVAPEQPKPTDPPTTPADPKPSDDPTAPTEPKPTDPPTSTPTDPPTTTPTDPPTTTPTTTPTDQPTTTPSTPAGNNNGSTGDNGSTDTGNGQTGNGQTGSNGSTGDTGSTDTGNGSTDNPSNQPGTPVTPPTTVPSTGGDTNTGDTNTGDTNTNTGDTNTGGDTSGDQSGDQNTDQDGQRDDDKPAEPVTEIVASLLPSLPVASSTTVETPPRRLPQYVGKSVSSVGKHSNGKPELGWAKARYAKGKHSSGRYAEGQHAAIARAHGSMAPVTIRQILGVLNTPMSDR
ncbi:hypothetical protein [Kribbella sp. NPDC023855]|uniref:hypothetical protein n=1 Tax=Kribbella sp. NPDC023855 TaxID=3154698 RepID=UPI0033DA6DDD